jgi:hypothetical protein
MIVLADKSLAGRDMERYASEQIRILLPARTARTSGAGSGTWPA